MTADEGVREAAERARAWAHAHHAAVCDVIEPWEHGTVVRATRYPDYWDYNLVRVEDDARLSADEVARLADEALAGLEHRQVGFEVLAAGERIRADMVERGWRATRLVWMLHEGPAPAPTGLDAEQVPWEAVRHLRLEWMREDFPSYDATSFLDQARELAARRQTQVFAAFERDAPVGYAQLERTQDGAEITNVFVHPDHRGRGLGTALTKAAIAAGHDAGDLWIVADDEGRPKQLYARLGFRAAWTLLDFLLVPGYGETATPSESAPMTFGEPSS